MNRKAARKVTRFFILTDTGPLVALIDEDDPYFPQASEALRRLPKVPLLTTWPCFTEAMYLLHQAGGYHAQDELWRFVDIGLVEFHVQTATEWRRMRELMRVFRDSPMDLADASIVAAAESLATDQVFTFDKHFYAYRLADGSALEVIG